MHAIVLAIAAAPAATFNATIGLRLTASAARWLEETALTISDPASSRYGECVPRAEVDARLAPSAAVVEAVTAWVGTDQALWSPARDFLTVAVARDSYDRLILSVPHNHVDYLRLDDTDAPAQPNRVQAAAPSHEARPEVTPRVIWRDLDIDLATYEKLPARVGIASPYNEILGTDQVQTFIDRWGVGSMDNLDTSAAAACTAATSTEPEPTLDVECCAATSPNATLNYYCAPGKPKSQFCDALLDYLAWIYETPDAPRVHTFSYGQGDCKADVRGKINVMLQKLATQRVTTLWAAGDAGAPGLNKAWFPSSSPWATAVGGTQLADASASAAIENWPKSGGGWDPAEQPANYSAAAVANYLSKAKIPSGKKTAGAPFVDVSAFAADVCGYSGCTMAGTSAATPMVASVMALLNAARASVNKSALGFANPLLYAHPEAMMDIVQGKGNGFPVAAGWDPATGLGMPQAEKLRKIVMALP